MNPNINEIIDYYSKASVSFCDILVCTVEPNSKDFNSGTNPFYSGLVIPLMGSACFTLNGTPYVMEPGMVVHAHQGMRLDKETIGEGAWRYAIIHYKIPESEVTRFPFYRSHFSFQTGSDAAVSDTIHQLVIHQELPDPSARFKSKLLFITLLGQLFDLAKEQIADSNTHLVEQIMEYLRQYCPEQITISSTAKHFGLDRRKLAMLFEKYAGMSPSNYLIECRMLKAKELLRTCSCPVKQIAEYVGYADSLYFSKAFKKYMGISPSEYQQRMKHSL